MSSWLPYYIRYDKELTCFAKILFRELLIYKQYGNVCRATNRELADIFAVSNRTVQDTISQLVKAGLIISEIINNDDKSFNHRNLIVKELL
jgi:DNA-binding MarR family transcriptional regulator